MLDSAIASPDVFVSVWLIVVMQIMIVLMSVTSISVRMTYAVIVQEVIQSSTIMMMGFIISAC